MCFLACCLLTHFAHASPDAAIATECASKIYADALTQTAANIDANEHETVIKQWIYQTFAQPAVLSAVLKCPEISGAPETKTIRFTPIQYTFPNGRNIIVNYETQPKMLQQRLQQANKRTLPNDHNPNPRIDAFDPDNIWTNTDPAWYAIMVVQHDALKDFVGPDKNNTISLKYIADNIDSLYPAGELCTSKSALALDKDTINQAVTKTVGLPADQDTNDYYVAGDVNLQWISYLEIGIDVAITVLTFGGGTVILGATKATRASRAAKNLTQTVRTLSKLDTVKDYMAAVRKADKLADELKQIDRATDAVRHADKLRELEQARDTVRTMENLDDVKKYRDASKTLGELNAYRRTFRVAQMAKRGNIVTRLAKATKSTFSGNKLIKHAAKLGRSSTISGQVRDWLFQSSLRNAGAIGKAVASGGLIYGAIQFVGGMYDWTETSTDQYTSGEDFSPLLLLSADDLQGQENVVNHGMWLLWAGDSFSVADDDAAYLQAMDFAAKFHQDLTEIQNDTATPCNVDIFVVRPILRNPNTENTQLYYLIMNDNPWTTND